MERNNLQLNFSLQYSDAVFDRRSRARKAQKVIAILKDVICNLSSLKMLDIGCSAGFMSECYAEQFEQVDAIDVDFAAIKFASEKNESRNLTYHVMDSQYLGFSDSTFDVVTCTHIYEHVPDAGKMMAEIFRVLKPGGICFFSAGNRLSFIEPHYQLPLLSVIPKSLAHFYLRLTGRGNHYYETHLSYWGLRALAKQFHICDYTVAVVKEPARYAADDMLPEGSVAHRVAGLVAPALYWLFPTYLWILKKPS